MSALMNARRKGVRSAYASQDAGSVSAARNAAHSVWYLSHGESPSIRIVTGPSRSTLAVRDARSHCGTVKKSTSSRKLASLIDLGVPDVLQRAFGRGRDLRDRSPTAGDRWPRWCRPPPSPPRLDLTAQEIPRFRDGGRIARHHHDWNTHGSQHGGVQAGLTVRPSI